MDSAKIESPKLPEMVMCGDHPSFAKTLLNMKETKPEDRVKAKESKTQLSQARISPTSSRTERGGRERTRSEHQLSGAEGERRGVRSLDLMRRADLDIAVHRNRALVQAAVGSFRWPPYLVAVWVLVLLLTHLLHCLVSVLERALPALKTVCQYFRVWTEQSWRAERERSRRVYPAALACMTGLLYSLYCALYSAHALALWAVEPMCSDAPEDRSEPRVTDYEDDATVPATASNIL